MVQFDGGCDTNGVGVVGFHIVDKNGVVLKTAGQYAVGFTSNHAECLGAFAAIRCVVENGWDAAAFGDFILV